MGEIVKRNFLYRLLRDDEENPMTDGIVAKCHLATVNPMEHIRYGSQYGRSSQWISTSRELPAIDTLIMFKRRKYGHSIKCRVVVIDEQRLFDYVEERENKRQLIQLLLKVTKSLQITAKDYLAYLSDAAKQITGQILDFTDEAVMDKHMQINPWPFGNDLAKEYAIKYKEVLVERFECCIAVEER